MVKRVTVTLSDDDYFYVHKLVEEARKQHKHEIKPSDISVSSVVRTLVRDSKKHRKKYIIRQINHYWGIVEDLKEELEEIKSRELPNPDLDFLNGENEQIRTQTD